MMPSAMSATVRDTVLEWILTGALRLGDAVDEVAVARSSGLPPADVRDALDGLCDLGVLVRTPAGYGVPRLEAGEVPDADEVRHLLEEVAIRRYVEHASPAQLMALRRALDEYAHVVAGSATPSELVRYRDLFFIVMFRACNGLAPASLLTLLRPKVGLVISVGVAAPGRPEQTLTELTEVYEALVDRDAERAVAACDRHRANNTDAGLRVLMAAR